MRTSEELLLSCRADVLYIYGCHDFLRGAPSRTPKGLQMLPCSDKDDEPCVRLLGSTEQRRLGDNLVVAGRLKLPVSTR